MRNEKGEKSEEGDVEGEGGRGEWMRGGGRKL